MTSYKCISLPVEGYIFDIDGTLTDKQGNVPHVIEDEFALMIARGKRIFLNTARSLKEVDTLMHNMSSKLGLSNTELKFMAFTSGGAEGYYLVNKTIRNAYSIVSDDFLRFTESLESVLSHGNAKIHYTNVPKKPTQANEVFIHFRGSAVTLYFFNFNEMKLFEQRVNLEYNLNLIGNEKGDMHVMSSGVSKLTAIDYLKTKLPDLKMVYIADAFWKDTELNIRGHDLDVYGAVPCINVGRRPAFYPDIINISSSGDNLKEPFERTLLALKLNEN